MARTHARILTAEEWPGMTGMIKVEMWAWSCQRCQHLWLPGDKTQIPRICPHCKSPRWQQPPPPPPASPLDRRLAAAQRKRLRQTGVAGQLAARDGWFCRYCTVVLTELTATIEHLIPLARGGSNHLSNLGLACIQCNCRKGTMTEAEFLEAL